MILKRRVGVILILCFLLSSITIYATDKSIVYLNETSTSWKFHLTDFFHSSYKIKDLQDPSELIDSEQKRSRKEVTLNDFITNTIDRVKDDSISAVNESYIQQISETKEQLLSEEVSDYFKGTSEKIGIEISEDITEFIENMLLEDLNNK